MRPGQKEAQMLKKQCIKRASRKDAAGPESAHWTLYRPKDVADKLNVPLEDVERVLEETGFNKAIRIREELLRLKTRLIKEQRLVSSEEQRLATEIRKVRARKNELSEQLGNIRDILRLPRKAKTD